jgi:hypothetical protein
VAQELQPVGEILASQSILIPTIGELIDRSWMLDAEFSGNGQEFAPGEAFSQQIMRLCGTRRIAPKVLLPGRGVKKVEKDTLRQK